MTNNVAAALHTFPQFDSNEDFIIFKERFENQLDVYDIPDISKSGILISSLNSDTYKILKNLCIPELPKNKSYDELISLLESHFVIKMSLFKARRIFYTAGQSRKESVNEWFTRVKTMAVNCGFGDRELAPILKDRFVSGLSYGPVFDSVADESPKMNVDNIIRIAVQKEDELKIKHRSNNLKPNDMRRSHYNRRHRSPRNDKNDENANAQTTDNEESKENQSAQQNRSPTLCWACGKPNHNFVKCKYKDFTCDNCHQVGHIVTVCKFPIRK